MVGGALVEAVAGAGNGDDIGAVEESVEDGAGCGDVAGFAAETPLAGEACADPVGQEADAHMVDDPLGLAMEDGADLEVTLEFAEGFFNFEEVFVVALDLGGISPVDGEVGVEEIPTVVGGLGGDGVLLAFPLKDADIVEQDETPGDPVDSLAVLPPPR